MKRPRLFTPAIAVTLLFVALTLMSAKPRGGRLFNAEGGSMMVFPGDSLNLSTLTFIVDGDTVSRQAFLDIDRSEIYSLTVTKGPANCIEITTVTAMTDPLPADTVPTAVRLSVDGVPVNAAQLRNIPADSIRRMTIVKGVRPALIISTHPDSALTR